MLDGFGGDHMPDQHPRLNVGSFDMADLFGNTSHNWDTIGPALWILFGTLFAGWLLRKIIRGWKGDDD